VKRFLGSFVAIALAIGLVVWQPAYMDPEFNAIPIGLILCGVLSFQLAKSPRLHFLPDKWGLWALEALLILVVLAPACFMIATRFEPLLFDPFSLLVFPCVLLPVYFWTTSRPRTALAVSALCVVGLINYGETGSVRGRVAARLDIIQGHFTVLNVGLGAHHDPKYTGLLQERYGIKDRALAECIVSRSLVAFVEGYDNISIPAIQRKFGQDVLAKTQTEAIVNEGREEPRLNR
jgi:hypothetical protein